MVLPVISLNELAMKFQSGQPGNPRGRPRGSIQLAGYRIFAQDDRRNSEKYVNGPKG